MIRFTTIALCVFAFATGCKKETEKGTEPGITAPSGKEGSAGLTAAPTEPAAGTTDPAAGGTVTGGTATGAAAAGATEPAKAEYKPDELWQDTAGLDRMAMMEKFKDGATVTGTVKEIKDDPTGEYVVVFDAGDGKAVEAMIADPKPARDKKLKAGDTVTVTKCQVANPTATALPLRTCELR